MECRFRALLHWLHSSNQEERSRDLLLWKVLVQLFWSTPIWDCCFQIFPKEHDKGADQSRTKFFPFTALRVMKTCNNGGVAGQWDGSISEPSRGSSVSSAVSSPTCVRVSIIVGNMLELFTTTRPLWFCFFDQQTNSEVLHCDQIPSRDYATRL